MTILWAQVTHEGQEFLKLTADQLWIFIGLQAQVFSQIIPICQKTGALLLGLAKSIYYTSVYLCNLFSEKKKLKQPVICTSHLFEHVFMEKFYPNITTNWNWLA